MMKNRWKLQLICVACVVNGIMLTTQTHATSNEISGDATIKFPLTVLDTFKYEVSVEGNGSLKQGDTRIRNGSIIYDMYVGETRIYQIAPDEGYRVKEIVCDREQINQDKEIISIAQVSGESHLKVIFEKIPEIIDKEEDQPPPEKEPEKDSEKEPEKDSEKEPEKEDSVLPSTGDHSPSLFWLLLLSMGSLVMMIFQIKHRRKETL